MAHRNALVAAALRSVERRLGWGKIKSTPFDETNGGTPFNASGVAQVGPGRFLFVDNHDPTALFELALDAGGTGVERISRRPLAGVSTGQLGDPEGLARVDRDGEICLVISASLSVSDAKGSGRQHLSDGLVRVRYTPRGELQAEAMVGFRDWLLDRVPLLQSAGVEKPDKGGLNVEGLGWDPDARGLVLGLRGPANRGSITVIRIPIDAGVAPWNTGSLGTPSIERITIPGSTGKQGVRDISYDEQAGDFLVMLGRSTSDGEEPFQLGRWKSGDDGVELLAVEFHRSMKPEGVVVFSSVGERKLLIVDDRGGYAIIDYPVRVQ